MKDKRINCHTCPLRNVETDVLCEDYCSDMADYREELRTDVICEIKKILPQSYCNNCNQISCEGGRVGSIQECASVRLLIDTLFELEDELKGQNK